MGFGGERENHLFCKQNSLKILLPHFCGTGTMNTDSQHQHTRTFHNYTTFIMQMMQTDSSYHPSLVNQQQYSSHHLCKLINKSMHLSIFISDQYAHYSAGSIIIILLWIPLGAQGHQCSSRAFTKSVLEHF